MASSVPRAAERSCAACRIQRTRCGAGCRLARFFPYWQVEDFKAVRRVYGTKNLLWMLDLAADEDGKRATRDSLVFEARRRLADPKNGCYGVALHLQNRLAQTEAERQRLLVMLNLVRSGWSGWP